MILPSKKFGVDTQRLGIWGFNQHCRASPGIQPFETSRPLVELRQNDISCHRQELCDEEWISVHYKTLIHMENSGTGCPGVKRGVPGDKIWDSTQFHLQKVGVWGYMQKKGVNSGLFLPWTDFRFSTLNFFFVLILAKKNDAGVRGCSNATRLRISKGSLPSAGVMLGGFESDGH